MGKTFILVTQKAEKLGAKHLPFFFETLCRENGNWVKEKLGKRVMCKNTK